MWRRFESRYGSADLGYLPTYGRRKKHNLGQSSSPARTLTREGNPLFAIGMQTINFPDCRTAAGSRTGVDCVLDKHIGYR